MTGHELDPVLSISSPSSSGSHNLCVSVAAVKGRADLVPSHVETRSSSETTSMFPEFGPRLFDEVDV